MIESGMDPEHLVIAAAVGCAAIIFGLRPPLINDLRDAMDQFLQLLMPRFQLPQRMRLRAYNVREPKRPPRQIGFVVAGLAWILINLVAYFSN